MPAQVSRTFGARARFCIAANAHIIGAEATELISEYSLAMTLEATVDEIHATIHPHPTLGEAIHI